MARKPFSMAILVIVIGAVLGGSVFLYFWLFRRAPQLPPIEPPRPVAPLDPSEEPPEPERAPLDLPPLDESDEMVRSLVTQVSEHPELATWVVPDNLVRRFVAVVDNVARDESPRPHLLHLDPDRGFEVDEDAAGMRISSRSFARYDLMADILASFDTDGAMRLYRDFEPLFEEAYADLGYPEGTFEDTLRQAIDRVLETPIPEDAPEVDRRITSYRYQDPAYERLGPVEKHLLRMGPENQRKIRSKLLVIKTALTLTGSEDEDAP